MGWQLTPYTIPLLAAALVGLGLGAYVYRIHRADRGRRRYLPLAVALSAIGWWATAHALQLSSTTVAGKFFWLKMLHFAPLVVPPAFLAFALLYTEREEWVTRPTLAVLAVEPMVTMALIWTNPTGGGLMWSSVGPVVGGTVPRLARSFGPWYLFNVAYSYALIGVGIAVLVSQSLSADRLYRRQAAVYAVAASLPVLTHAAFMAGLTRINFTSLATLATGAVLTVAIVRYGLFRVASLARDRVIESMRDGYVVVDTEGRIVDFNDAGERVLTGLAPPGAPASPVGATVDAYLPDLDPTSALDAGDAHRTEVVLDGGDGADGEGGDDRRVLSVTVDPLVEDGRTVGYLLNLRDVTDRRAAERRFATLVEEASDLFAILDPDGEVTYASPSSERILGVPEKDLEGASVYDRVHPDDRAAVEDAVGASVEVPDERVTFDARLRDGDGNYRAFDGVVRDLRADPAVDGVVLNAHDVTDREAREEKLRRYETIVEAVGDPVYTLDRDRTLTFVNEALVEMTGYDEDVLVGSDAQLLMDEADIERGDELIADLVHSEGRSRDTFEMDVLTRDGERIPVENNVALLDPEEAALGGTAGILRDISDRRAREEELERFETIVNSLADPVWVTDAEGFATYVNPAFEEHMGHDEGVHFTELLDEDDTEATLEAIRRLLSSDFDTDREIVESEFHTADGRVIPAENHMSLLPYEDEFRGAAGVVRDVSEQRRRREVMDVMNRALRHNLRTHVNSIDGYAEMVESSVGGSDAEHLAQIRESADWLDTLGGALRELREAVDQDRGGSGVVDLARVVDDVVATHREAHPAATVRSHVPDEQYVEAGEALAHALDHLVENAVVHSDREHPEVHVSLTPAPDAGWVDLRVEDDGPGIPAEERDLVTGDEDSTQLHHASGLGLWITRWIVETFDGVLRFEENDPRGSVVVIRLQRAGADPGSAGAAASADD